MSAPESSQNGQLDNATQTMEDEDMDDEAEAEDVDESEQRKRRRKARSVQFDWSRLPVTRRNELQEHAHLLKTLKTNAISDLSSLLLDQLVPEASANGDSGLSRTEFRKVKDKRKKSTLWPINHEQLQIPMFSWNDEIACIARKVILEDPTLRYQLSGTEEDESNSISENILDHPALSSQVIDPLSVRSDALLRLSLDLLHKHRMPMAASTITRHRPLGWETLLSSLAATDAVDPLVLERAAERIQAIFGPGQRSNPPLRFTSALQKEGTRQSPLKDASDSPNGARSEPATGQYASYSGLLDQDLELLEDLLHANRDE